MDIEQTQASNLGQIGKEQTEAEFAATHKGFKNWIDYFNGQEVTILFGVSRPETLAKPILNSICRAIKKGNL